MKKIITFVMLAVTGSLFSQKIENGDFENTTASSDQINLSNSALNAMLHNVTAFGSYGDVDIICSSTYGGGGAKNGKWYIALTGGRTDIVALRLTEPLKKNKIYTLSFYDRKDRNHPTQPVSIGISNSNSNEGKLVYTSDSFPEVNKWSKRTCTIKASNNEQFITVFMESGSVSDWVNIDHFTLSESNKTVKDSIVEIVSLKKDSVLIMNDVVKSPDTTFIVHHDKQWVQFNKRRLNGRRYEIQKSISVSEDEISVFLWDKNKVDGDIVSVYRNGELIQENISITKEKKELRIQLESGSNVITVFALNLGKIPPNTVAMGTNIQKYKCITLVSDLKMSGSLEVIYEPNGLATK